MIRQVPSIRTGRFRRQAAFTPLRDFRETGRFPIVSAGAWIIARRDGLFYYSTIGSR
jgi:hypothetical protein